MNWKSLLLVLIAIALPVDGGTQSQVFKDKSVRVLVGFPPGGGSDAEGRVIARHLGKYNPGNPSRHRQNMPGAGGLIASNCFEDRVNADGLKLYYCVGSTAITQQAFGVEGGKYDMRGWEVLGSGEDAEMFRQGRSSLW